MPHARVIKLQMPVSPPAVKIVLYIQNQQQLISANMKNVILTQYRIGMVTVKTVDYVNTLIQVQVLTLKSKSVSLNLQLIQVNV